MRLLLTGATGFFGSRTAAHLHARGHEVHALVRPGSDLRRLRALAPNVPVVEGTMTKDDLPAVVERVRPEICVHLAWIATPGKYLDSLENLDHLTASLELLKALSAAGCRRVLTAGTCFEYDTTEGLLKESTRTSPRFLYASAKLALGEVFREAARVSGFEHAHLRFFYQYGPWEHAARLVPSVVRALLAGQETKTTLGEQIRDFLHIDDVASAVTCVAESDAVGAVNVGSGVPVRVADVVRAAAEACGRPDLLRLGALAYRSGDPMFVCADASRLRALGWTPRFDLASGMQDTVRYWREEHHDG